MKFLLLLLALKHYDLSSLWILAEDVVATEAIATSDWSTAKPVEFRISKVYKGSLKKGDRLSISLASYRVFRAKNLETMDGVVFFLEKKEKDDEARTPVPSGIKLVTRDAVWAFRQLMNPGPYEPVLGTPERIPQEKGYRLERFEEDLDASKRNAEAFEAVRSTKETGERNRALLEFMAKERTVLGRRWELGSFLLFRAAELIAESKDPESCFRALDHVSSRALVNAFNGRRGRDWLVDRLPMKGNRLEDRLRALTLIADVRYVETRGVEASFDGNLIDHLVTLLGDAASDIREATAHAILCCSFQEGEIIPGNPDLPRTYFRNVTTRALDPLMKAYGVEKSAGARYAMALAVGRLGDLERYAKLTGDSVGIPACLEVTNEGDGAIARSLRYRLETLSRKPVKFQKLDIVIQRVDDRDVVAEQLRVAAPDGFLGPIIKGGFGLRLPVDARSAPGRWRVRLEGKTEGEPPKHWFSPYAEFTIEK